MIIPQEYHEMKREEKLQYLMRHEIEELRGEIDNLLNFDDAQNPYYADKGWQSRILMELLEKDE